MTATGTEARVCADIAARQALGVAKYGTTVEANPLALIEWLRHAYEEALDLAVYLKRAQEALEADAEHAALYRWLRAAHLEGLDTDEEPRRLNNAIGTVQTEDEMDAAIRAAIAAERS